MTYIPYLFPHPFHSDNYYADSLKNLKPGIENEPQKIANFKKALTIQWGEQFFLIVVGVVSGILVIKKNIVGRALLLSLCGYVIFQKISHQLNLFHTFDIFFIRYALMFKYKPVQVLHIDIISSVIVIATFICLLLPSVSVEFNKKSS